MDQLGTLQAWMSGNADSFEAACAYILAAIALPFAYGVIFDPKIIRSGFLLIGVFACMGGLFLLLQAQFLAMAQIMIYAVGITLVVVIALMLTNQNQEVEENTAIVANQYLGFVVALFLFMTIYMSLFGEQFPITVEKAVTPNLVLIGTALCTTYALPFEFSSILLLAAVVGAIMLAKNESKMAPDEDDEYDDDTDDDAGNSQEFKLKRDTDGAAAASTSR
jgi:NADH:ubiquinone oxidoreductase subunit 6 (subunit J)